MLRHCREVNGKVWRAADAELDHNMSVMDYNRLMTPDRCLNLSAAESAFSDLYRGRLENAVQNLRLLGRAIKQRGKYRDPEFSRYRVAAVLPPHGTEKEAHRTVAAEGKRTARI